MSSTGTVIPTSTQRPAPVLHWSSYYTQELYLERNATTGDRNAAKFHVYLTPPPSPTAPLLVLHHGAGSSALSFGMFAKEVRKAMPEVGILAVEAREHGSVVWTEDGSVDNDLSIDLLGRDLIDMLELTRSKMSWTELPNVLLIGHSLGGAVVVHVANEAALGNKLMGYAVLDVVEGSAMELVQHMQSYLATRPESFPNLDAAIEWHIRSRTLRNPQSARASVPSLLIQTSDGRWTWRTDLLSTKLYWEDWFTGMSAKFLKGKGAKLLILAGTDRLDKELMIGQMQGKCLYILSIDCECGYLICTQENFSSRSSLLQATSSMRTYLRRLPSWWLSL
jgi:protein phosphatase methylesterase 1